MSDPSGLMVDCGNGYCGLPACNNGGATAGSSRDPGGCNVNCSKDPAVSKWVNRGAIDVDLTPVKKKPRRWYQPVRNLVAGFGDRISEQWRGLEDASCFVSQEGHPWGCGSAPMTELARPSNAVRALTGADDPDIDRTSRGYKTGRVIADLVGPIPLIAPAAIEQTAAVTATRAATRAAWRLSNVGKNRQDTLVPESFDIFTAGEKFSVHPNATKHMAEYARSTGTAPPISSFAGSIETAVQRGLGPGRNFIAVGSWELGIDTGGNVVYHALYRPEVR